MILSSNKLATTYDVHKKLSNGCFGYVFLVTNKIVNRMAALKVEFFKSESSATLKKEYAFLKRLEGIKGIPEVYNYGRGEKFLYMEIQLLESDLGCLG